MLRLMQISIPEDDAPNLASLLEGHEVLSSSLDTTSQNKVVIQVLVHADEAEPIMDRFEEAYADSKRFSIVLLPVEAALPRPKGVTSQARGSGDSPEQSADSAKDSARVGREELYSDIAATLGADRAFVAMTILSSIVATVGLVRNDVAVIIGAMVIAPLLGPNVAMSLATTLGDLQLLRRSLLTNFLGLAIAFGLSFAVGLAIAVDPDVPAIAARTHLGLGDLALALAAGSAGTLAFTRGLTGAVIGVMVAVALVPPLVAFGLLLGSGYIEPALGALLLVAGNVVCINLAGVATFLIQGVRPRSWWEGERAKKSSYIAMIIWFLLLVGLGIAVYSTQV